MKSFSLIESGVLSWNYITNWIVSDFIVLYGRLLGIDMGLERQDDKKYAEVLEIFFIDLHYI